MLSKTDANELIKEAQEYASAAKELAKALGAEKRIKTSLEKLQNEVSSLA